MSQHVSWSLKEMRLKKALLGLLTLGLPYAGRRPEIECDQTGCHIFVLRIKRIQFPHLPMNCAHLWEWKGDSRGLGGPVWTIKWPEQLIRPWWWLNKTSDFSEGSSRTHGEDVNHLWISCHYCVVPIIIVSCGLNMQSAASVLVSYLLVMDVLFEDLLAIFEPVNLLRMYTDFYSILLLSGHFCGYRCGCLTFGTGIPTILHEKVTGTPSMALKFFSFLSKTGAMHFPVGTSSCCTSSSDSSTGVRSRRNSISPISLCSKLETLYSWKKKSHHVKSKLSHWLKCAGKSHAYRIVQNDAHSKIKCISSLPLFKCRDLVI